MSTIELIKLSIKKHLLNELFSAMLSDLPQGKISIKEQDNINLNEIVQQINDDDILITNDQYDTEKADFIVLNSLGDILLNVSPDGQLINNNTFEDYLEETMLDELVKLYNYLLKRGIAYTVQFATA